MSRRIADLLIKIGADSYEFQQKAKEVEKGLAGLEKKLTNMGKTLSMKLTAPLMALGGASLALADTQLKAEAKVQQAIKSTSGAARLNFQQLKDFASELQGKTLFGDEAILNNATAQLLTFTNIAGENFKRTQTVALDLDTVLDGDLKSASIQLGKALNDPVKNLSALSRSGIQFSEQQKEVINHLAKTNRLAEAQSVILDELERQYGGQAQQAAKVGLGAAQQLKNAWGDLMEKIGNVMLPLVDQLSKALMKVVIAMQNMNPVALKITVAVAGLAAAVGPLSLALGGVMKILPMLSMGFTAILSPVGLVVSAILALGAAFVYAKNKQEEMIDSMATKYENLSLRTLESNLKENRRLQAMTQNEQQWIKGRGVIPNLTFVVNKPKRMRELKMEEQALVEAINRTKKAISDKARAEQEAAEIAQQMEDALKGVSLEADQQGGILNELKNKIAALEKKKLLPSSSVEDIAACNAEIEKLQAELKRLESIKPEDLLPKERIQSLLPVVNIEIPAPKLTANLGNLRRVVDEYSVQMQEIFTSVREGIYGWADDTNSMMQANFADMFKIVENYTAALTEKGWKFSEALEHVQSTMASTMQRFEASVSQFLADSIVAAADAIGQVIAGDLGFGGLMKAILTQLANFLKNIGAQLIEFGVMIVAFKSTLKSVLANPWAAIGVGAAMVAAAAVMTALINKNAQENVPALASGGLAYGKTLALVGDNANAAVDPEVIAPLSKLQAMLPAAGASQNINITLGGQLVAKGRDLAYVLNKENYKNSVMGG